jgi:hypothetical protein
LGRVKLSKSRQRFPNEYPRNNQIDAAQEIALGDPSAE